MATSVKGVKSQCPRSGSLTTQDYHFLFQQNSFQILHAFSWLKKYMRRFQIMNVNNISQLLQGK